MRPTRALLTALAAAAILSGCGPHTKSERYSRQQLQESLRNFEAPGLVIGEFVLANNGVIDGDTIRVEGLDTPLRLLAIDSEETFKSKHERAEAERDFQAYMERQRAKSKRPPKCGTPMGEEATEWAKQFFAGSRRVRLERDHPKEIRDRFNRYLAYVFVQKDGQWLNYNVEHVRAGMSPYFSKYSYSRRFHDEFVAAEEEARANRVGIWDPTSKSYQDYDERKEWWDARAEFIKEFERVAQERDDYIVLTHFDSLRQLEKRLGQEVTLLATVGEIRLGDRGPTRVLLSRRLFSDFTVVFFDRDVFLSSGISRYRSEFVKVTGVVNTYQNKYTKKRELQIIVNLPSQVVGSKVPGLEPLEPASASME
jgi:endonuclease YncB( thermonuclease family)